MSKILTFLHIFVFFSLFENKIPKTNDMQMILFRTEKHLKCQKWAIFGTPFFWGPEMFHLHIIGFWKKGLQKVSKKGQKSVKNGQKSAKPCTPLSGFALF